MQFAVLKDNCFVPCGFLSSRVICKVKMFYKCLVNQSMKHSVNHDVHSINNTVIQILSKESNIESVRLTVNQLINQSNKHSVSQEINQSIKQSVSQSVHQSIH